MSSIPLPALHVDPVQVPDMIGNYTRALQLKQAIQNQPLQNEALQQQVQNGALAGQSTQLDIQQKQREAASQDAVMQAWQASGGDLTKAHDIAAKSGKVLPADLAKIQQANYQLQTQAMELVKARGDRAVQEGDLMAGAVDTVKNSPPEARPAIYQQQVANLAKAGVDVSQVPQQYPGDQAFGVMNLGIKSHKAALDEAAKQASTAMDNAKAGEATAQTNKLSQETQFGPTGDAAEAKYRFILQKKASGQPLSPDDVSFARGFEASSAKTSTTSDTLGVTSANSSRPAGLASVGVGNRGPALAPAPGGNAPASGNGSQETPASTRNSIVDLIGQYRYDPAQLGRLVAKHPDVMALIQQKYPDFDQTTYQAKNKVMQGYTSGPQSREINAYNTTMGHLSVLDNAVSALNNGDVRVLNSIANGIGVGTGNDAQTVFKAIVHRVGPEITGAYISGGGGEGERAGNANDFNENMAPQQLHTNIAMSAKLLDSKVQALENQYKNTVGRDDFAKRFITPEAQAARSSLIGGNGGGKTTHYKIVNGELVPQA